MAKEDYLEALFADQTSPAERIDNSIDRLEAMAHVDGAPAHDPSEELSFRITNKEGEVVDVYFSIENSAPSLDFVHRDERGDSTGIEIFRYFPDLNEEERVDHLPLKGQLPSRGPEATRLMAAMFEEALDAAQRSMAVIQIENDDRGKFDGQA